jgi:hypothetical protein
MLARERQEKLGGALRLLVAHAGYRLVQEESLGSCMSSIAISSHCFWPCERSPRAIAGVGQAHALERRGDAVSLVRTSFREERAPHALVAFIASSRFSNALWFSKIVGFWNLRPIPACAIWIPKAA